MSVEMISPAAGARCVAFGLERGQSLEGPATRKLRAAALSARLVFDASIREGSAAGRQRARSGDLARDAAAAHRAGYPDIRAFLPARAAAADRGPGPDRHAE
jgi:hypothetical protein